MADKLLTVRVTESINGWPVGSERELSMVDAFGYRNWGNVEIISRIGPEFPDCVRRLISRSTMPDNYNRETDGHDPDALVDLIDTALKLSAANDPAQTGAIIRMQAALNEHGIWLAGRVRKNTLPLYYEAVSIVEEILAENERYRTTTSAPGT